MGAQTGKPACPYLDELIALLDEEADTRDCPHRPELLEAMGELAQQARLAGASALTISMIHASRSMIRVGAWMPPPRLH